jgi:hypothetical protein
LAALLLVAVGLYQTGYTGVEWEAIKARAERRGISQAQAIESKDGRLGYLRMVWMTNSDERLYAEYARLTLHGKADLTYIAEKQYAAEPPEAIGKGAGEERLWPYRDVRVEYPPVAVLGMTLPGLITLDPWGYRFALGVFNLLLLLLCWRLATPAVDTPAEGSVAVGRLLWLTLLLGIVTVTRMDLLAAALTLGAVWAGLRERPGLSGLLTALGTMAKLFTGLWAIAYGVLLLRRRRWRHLLAFAGVSVGLLAALNLALWGWAGEGYLDTYLYHRERGIQIESSWASVLLPIHLVADLDVGLALEYGSSNLTTPLDGFVRSAWPFLFVGLALPFVAAGWRRERAAPIHLLAGLVLAFLLANKVFSPQYLLWVFPLLLFDGTSRGRVDAIIFLAACGLSQVLYPRGYDLLKAFHPAAVAVLVARNGLVAWLWWRMVARVWGRASPDVVPV